MPLLATRVDNRLVHGQVLEGWVPALGIDLVIVADESLFTDNFHKTIVEAMGAGWPEIEVVRPPDSQTCVSANPGRNTMLIFRDLDAVLSAIEGGLTLETLNLGNIHFTEGSRKITDSVYLDARAALALEEILKSGVRVEARAVPGEAAVGVTGAALR